jgi:hypothetical protein
VAVSRDSGIAHIGPPNSSSKFNVQGSKLGMVVSFPDRPRYVEH